MRSSTGAAGAGEASGEGRGRRGGGGARGGGGGWGGRGDGPRGLAQPLDAGERGAAALQLLRPEQDRRQRVGQLPQIQRRGDHHAQADPAPPVQRPAGQQDTGHREDIRDIHDGQQHTAQEQRAGAGAAAPLDRLLARRRPALLEPQRLDGPGARGGGRQQFRERRGRRALRQIRAVRPAQIPPDHEHPAEHPQPAQTEQRIEHHHRSQQEQRLRRGDTHLRHGVPQRPGDRGDVRRTAGRQVTGTCPLHDRGRQRERPVHILLADPRHGPLTEAVPDVPGVARQQQLHQPARQDDQRQPVHRAHPAAGPHRVHDPAEQPGAGQTGAGRQGVEREHQGEGPAVPSDQPERRPPGRGRTGHRQRHTVRRGVLGPPGTGGGRRHRASSCVTGASAAPAGRGPVPSSAPSPSSPRDTRRRYPGCSSRS